MTKGAASQVNSIIHWRRWRWTGERVSQNALIRAPTREKKKLGIPWAAWEALTGAQSSIPIKSVSRKPCISWDSILQPRNSGLAQAAGTRETWEHKAARRVEVGEGRHEELNGEKLHDKLWSAGYLIRSGVCGSTLRDRRVGLPRPFGRGAPAPASGAVSLRRHRVKLPNRVLDRLSPLRDAGWASRMNALPNTDQ